MSGSSASPSAARRLLVVLQVMLMVATLFAPIPAAAVEPDPTPTPSAEPTPTPTPEPTPDPTPTPEPSAEPILAPETTPDPSVEPDPTPTPEPSPEPSPTPTPEAATVPFIVTFASGVSGTTQDDILSVVGAVQTDSIPQLRMRAILLAPSAVTDSLAALRDDARVLRVDTDRVRIAEETPSDPFYSDQWALPLIGWDTARDTYSAAGSAVVAILDTGVDASHPDLDGSIVTGASILEGSTWSSDPNGHGTAMAGIVAAETNNAEGIAGVGYAGVSVMPITVLGADGTGQDSDVIEGVVWAADHGADVILMAFSSASYSASLQAAVDYAWSSGAVLVAAAGNDGASVGAFPAGDRGVIGVSNTTSSDTLAASSNYGPSIFLGAPGVAIYTTDAGGGYRYVSGTSASAAVVAGAAAQLFAVDPSASNGVVVGRLARTADPAGTADETGNGRVNLARALGDTSTESVQPAGSAPVGDGGPFVGPYVAANKNLTITFAGTGGGSIAFSSVTGLPAPTTNPCIATCMNSLNNNATGTLTVTANANSTFVGWSGVFGSGGTTTCAASTSPCTFSLSNDAQALTATFRANTTTSITNAASLSATPSALGAAYAVNVSVTRTGTSTTNVAGTVTVSDGLDSCIATLTAAQPTASGTCNLSSTTAGAKTLTATYAGNVNYNGSVSAGVAHTVNTANTTTTITSDLPDPSVVGEGYMVAVTVTRSGVSATLPTGTVLISDGSATCTTDALAGPVTGRTASCALTSTTAGTKTLTATYAGDTNYNGSVSAGVAHTVNTANTTTTITSDLPDPSVVGQLVTIAHGVTVNAPGAGTPTGNVTITDSASLQTCTATVAAGLCSIAFTATGIHNLTATYAGDTNFNGSASTPVTVHVVNKAGTTTTISSHTPDPSAVGESVSVSYSVAVNAPGAGTPTGTVTITDADSAATCAATVATGSCSLTLTGPGTHHLTATYAGDTNFLGSTSAVAPHEVSKAATTTTITNSVNPSVFGQSITLTATITVNAPGSGSPTGTVEFFVDSVSVGSFPVSGAFTATYVTASLSVGDHDIDATYSGDAELLTSDATTFVQRVDKADTSTVVVSDDDTSTYGDTVLFTATVTSDAPGSGTPTGMVQFFDGIVSLGNGALIAGQASLSISTLSAGSHTISAKYLGDGSFNVSISGDITQSVTKKTLTVTADPRTKVYGEANPALTFGYDGFENGDDAGDLTTEPTCSTLADETSSVGDYAIDCAGGDDENYAFSYVAGNLEITKKTLVVTPDAKTRIYGQAAPVYTFAVTGFENLETAATAAGYVAPSCTSAYTVTSPVSASPLTITCSGGSADNYSFNTTATAELTITRATLVVTADNRFKILGAPNPALTSIISGFKNGETLATSGVTGSPSLTTTAITASPVGSYPIAATLATLTSSNYSFTFVNGTLKVLYSLASCLGSPGHQVLQPVNNDGSSVFKKGSTVPVKFRVCDADGNSIGTAGVVTSLQLTGKFIGLDEALVIEDVVSTTPDTAFRWSSTDQQWIFNLNTKNLTANYTYRYTITLNDGSTITFEFGLK